MLKNAVASLALVQLTECTGSRRCAARTLRWPKSCDNMVAAVRGPFMSSVVSRWCTQGSLQRKVTPPSPATWRPATGRCTMIGGPRQRAVIMLWSLRTFAQARHLPPCYAGPRRCMRPMRSHGTALHLLRSASTAHESDPPLCERHAADLAGS